MRLRAAFCTLGVCSLHPDAGIGSPAVEQARIERVMTAPSVQVAAMLIPDKTQSGHTLHRRVGEFFDLSGERRSRGGLGRGYLPVGCGRGYRGEIVKRLLQWTEASKPTPAIRQHGSGQS